MGRTEPATLRQELASRVEGLRQAKVDAHLSQVGPNAIARERRQSPLIIHMICTNRIPFIQSRASWPLIATSLIIVAVGAWLTVSLLAGTLGFVPPPPFYWLLLALMLPCYVILTQLVKTWFYRRYSE